MKTLSADSLRPASRLSSDHVTLHFGRCSSPSDRFMPESTDGRAVAVFWVVPLFYRRFEATCCLHTGQWATAVRQEKSVRLHDVLSRKTLSFLVLL